MPLAKHLPFGAITRAMLRAYGPGCDGSVDRRRRSSESPTTRRGSTSRSRPTRKRRLVERCIGVDVPTQAEMAEIEPSSRLYEKNGALYMTASALRGVDEAHPTTTPISFVLAGNRLVTIRYATPKPVRDLRKPCPARSRPGARRADRAGAAARRDHRPPRRRDRERQRADGAALAGNLPGAAGRATNSGGQAHRAADEHRADADLADQDPLFGGQHACGC